MMSSLQFYKFTIDTTTISLYGKRGTFELSLANGRSSLVKEVKTSILSPYLLAMNRQQSAMNGEWNNEKMAVVVDVRVGKSGNGGTGDGDREIVAWTVYAASSSLWPLRSFTMAV